MVRDLEEKWLENWFQGNLWKNFSAETSMNGKKNWIYFCFMWMVTTGRSQQRKILTIKWIWWPVLWIPISLSLAFSIITQWAHKQSIHGYKNGIFVQAEQRGLPPTKADLATDIAECPVCQPWKPTLSPWYGSIAQVISQQLSGGRLIKMVRFHHFHHGNILLSLDQTLILIHICHFL